MLFVITLICFLGQHASTARPEALENFERARAQLRTGRITCVVTGGPHIVGMPVNVFGMQIAKDGDVWYTYHGDAQGVLARDDQGYPLLVGGAQTLVEPRVAWHKQTNSFSGTIVPRSVYRPKYMPTFWGSKVDLRTIGMAPTWESLVGQDIRSVLTNATEDCSGYSVEHDGSIHRVTVHYPDEREMIYEIDEAKGWNASRIAGRDAGGDWHCVIELCQVQGGWFPRVATLYRNGEQRTEWMINEASFNSPDDPDGWGPADIGFEVGMYVGIRGQTKAAEGPGLCWDGQKASPAEEVMNRIRAGELQAGPTLKRQGALKGEYEEPGTRLLQRLRTSPYVLESFISLWEYYVAKFCTRYDLDADQESRAWRILRDCQKSAHHYLNRNMHKFTALEKKRDRGDLSPKRAEEEFAKLRKPVDDIFENQLKPRLEKIPTRKQKEHAGQGRNKLREASAPPEPNGSKRPRSKLP